MNIHKELISRASKFIELQPLLNKETIFKKEVVVEIVEEPQELPLCKTCGEPFKKTRSTQVNCQDCIDNK